MSKELVTDFVASASGVSVIDPMTFASLDSIKKFVTDELREIFYNNFPVGSKFDQNKIITTIPDDIGNEVCFHFCQILQHKKGSLPVIIADVTIHGEDKIGWMKYIS